MMGVSGASMSITALSTPRVQSADMMCSMVMHAVAAGFDGRAARSVYDVVAQGGNYGLSFEVGAAEYDSGSGLGGIHGHGNFDARMQALSRE